MSRLSMPMGGQDRKPSLDPSTGVPNPDPDYPARVFLILGSGAEI